MQDILIKNALIADGSGSRAYYADIAIESNIINEIAPKLNTAAKRTIDAQGLVLSPGFIDVHSHDDLVFFSDPFNKAKLLQGVTTVICGNCGFGPCPSSGQRQKELAAYASPVLGDGIAGHCFSSFKEYRKALTEQPKAINLGALLAHGSTYLNEKGFSSAPIALQEAESMAAVLRESLDEGALGLSLGLMYAPGAYCSVDDFLPLCRILAERESLLCVHLRSESDLIEKAIEEIIQLNHLTGVAMHLSHLKKVGYTFKGQIGAIIDKLEKNIDQGLDLSFDMYPYSIGSTTMSILFPPNLLTGGIDGFLELLKQESSRSEIKKYFSHLWPEADNLALFCGWDNIIISTPETLPGLGVAGRSIAEIAMLNSLAPDEACLKIFEAAQGQATILLRNMADSDLKNILMAQHCFIASDGLPAGASPHPRLYGTYPRFLEIFVRQDKAMPLEEAVSKMTFKPARRFHLGKRGLIKPGFIADLVIFDPDNFKDISSFENPRQHPEGLHYVFVAGKSIVENGLITGNTSGSFLDRSSSI